MEVVTAHPIVDAVLDRHRDQLGDDLPTYRNHVYRCISYHLAKGLAGSAARHPLRPLPMLRW